MPDKNGLLIAGIVLCLVGLCTHPGMAETAGNTPTHYALVDGSTYQHGCFPPCMCPMMETAPVKGSLVLIHTGFDGLFDLYDVSEVNWTAVLVDGTLRSIQGSGVYRVGGEFAVMHELSLDLKVDGEPVAHFSSGLVAGGGSFPAIEAKISIHGEFCVDTAIQVVAKPTTELSLTGDAIVWQALPTATGYDIVVGNLDLLRQTGGDFKVAAQTCLANDTTAGPFPYATTPGPGQARWMLVRPVAGSGAGSWDSGSSSQLGSRDAEIAVSPGACP